MSAPVRGETVTLVPTCLVEQLRPSLEGAVVKVLEDHGAKVELSRGSTCCGQPAWNGGLAEEARRVARTTLKALSRTSTPIIVPSGSCATMMREFWPELFRGTRQERDAKAVASRVREFSEYIAPLVGETGPSSEAVAYHDSCHMLRELGIKEQPRVLLAEAGTEVVEMQTGHLCCGFGGTFSVKLPEVSVAMADEKLNSVEETGTGTLVGCDLSCLVHLEGRAERRGMGLKVQHLAEYMVERRGG